MSDPFHAVLPTLLPDRVRRLLQLALPRFCPLDACGSPYVSPIFPPRVFKLADQIHGFNHAIFSFLSGK
jgi:hypothetical protein